MGRSSRNAGRWRQALKRNRGVHATIEFIIPIPQDQRLRYREAKQEIVEKINPAIDDFKRVVKDLEGITKIYQHV